VQSWLIGVGWVVYAGQLSGRWFCDAWPQAWAHRRRGHKEPGGEEEHEQCPRESNFLIIGWQLSHEATSQFPG